MVKIVRKSFVISISLLFAISFVFAAHVILPTAVTITEDSSNSLFNISVNNTDNVNFTSNISQVDFIIPATFTFVDSSNGTDAGVHTFSNTSTVLTWANDGLVMNETLNYFWFNASASTPGTYNITVNTTNSTGIFASNVSVTVNDTTSPSTIDFVSPSELDNVNLSRDNIEVNVSASDNGALDTITLFLYNSSNLLVSSVEGSGDFNYTNFSSLDDGVYYFNATVNDTFGNSNSTLTTRTVTIDTINPLVDYSTGVNSDNANITEDFIYVNSTVTEINFANITFELYNSTALVNTTTFTDSRREINFTSLADEDYSYNVTVVDFSYNTNITSTRTLTIDTTNPLIDYSTGVNSDNANITEDFIYVNVTATEANEVNITFELYNSTALVNTTTYTDSTRNINFTGLADEDYSYNVTIYDAVGNSNTTNTRTLNIDTGNPLVDYGSGIVADNTNSTDTFIYTNITVTEVNEVNVTFELYNSTALVNSSTYTDSRREINWTGLADEVYKYNVTVFDSSSNSNTTATRTFTVDTTNPLVSYGSGLEVDNANVTDTFIYINVSVTESNEANITFSLYNSSGTVNSTTYTDSRREINWTGLADAEYEYNVSVYDFTGNTNVTSTRTLSIDSSPPVVTLISPANATSATTTAYNFTFNVTDVVSIVNCSLNLDGSVANNLFDPAKEQTLGMYNSSIAVGSHNWSITCYDYLNNSATSTDRYFTVSAAAEESSSSSSSGGGGSGYPRYRPSNEDLGTGYEATLAKNYKINFNIGGEDHSLNMDNIGDNFVTVTISSDPITVEIREGETEKVDVDHDGFYDLSIFNKEIKVNRADLILTSISERIENNDPILEELIEESVKSPTTGNAAGDTEDKEVENSKSYVVLYFVVAFFVLALIVGYLKRKGITKLFSKKFE